MDDQAQVIDAMRHTLAVMHDLGYLETADYNTVTVALDDYAEEQHGEIPPS